MNSHVDQFTVDARPLGERHQPSVGHSTVTFDEAAYAAAHKTISTNILFYQ